jgi:hypothetical protein
VGTIPYGQIEIECGGQIFGDIDTRSRLNPQRSPQTPLRLWRPYPKLPESGECRLTWLRGPYGFADEVNR